MVVMATVFNWAKRRTVGYLRAMPKHYQRDHREEKIDTLHRGMRMTDNGHKCK